MVTTELRLGDDHTMPFRVWSGDGPRFAECFLQTWLRLPAEVREAMARHWERMLWSSLELSNVWRKHRERFAEVTAAGSGLRFNAEEIDIMPVPAIEFLIAHELAHVYQHATGRLSASFSMEDDANELAWTWGFDQLPLLDWKARRQLSY